MDALFSCPKCLAKNIEPHLQGLLGVAMKTDRGCLAARLESGASLG